MKATRLKIVAVVADVVVAETQRHVVLHVKSIVERCAYKKERTL